MKRGCLPLAVCAIAAVLAASCKSKVEDRIPKQLGPLGAQFKQTAGQNRKELAEQLRPLLPTCCREGAGRSQVINYSKPTYFLRRAEVIQILGQPDQVVAGDFVYNLGSDSKRAAFLSVEFYDDHVTLTRIYEEGIRPTAQRRTQ